MTVQSTYFRVKKNIWEENIMGKTCVIYTGMNKDKKSIEGSYSLYQTYTPPVITHTGGAWLIHAPNHKENQLPSLV